MLTSDIVPISILINEIADGFDLSAVSTSKAFPVFVDKRFVCISH
jgi:hypothetical protein